MGHLLDKAIESRKEEDVGNFMRSLAEATAEEAKFQGQLVPQFIADWNIDSKKIEVWVQEGIDAAENFEGDIERMEKRCHSS
jgi:hypothetical protein